MFDVRPGITGWAQVHGRKSVEWRERIPMNVWYTRHVSLALDVKILCMTVFKVLRNDDKRFLRKNYKRNGERKFSDGAAQGKGSGACGSNHAVSSGGRN